MKDDIQTYVIILWTNILENDYYIIIIQFEIINTQYQIIRVLKQ